MFNNGDIKDYDALEKHIENLQQFNVPVVVTLNKFITDSDEEVALIKKYCKKHNCSLTWKQIKTRSCLGKQCWHLVKYDHEVWRQRELQKQRKKASRAEIKKKYGI